MATSPPWAAIAAIGREGSRHRDCMRWRLATTGVILGMIEVYSVVWRQLVLEDGLPGFADAIADAFQDIALLVALFFE